MALASPASETASDTSLKGSPATTNHLTYLDGLRGVAALYVFLHHLWLEIWPVLQNRQPTGLMWKLTGWLLYGHFAVDLFIVLSGYCLTLPVVTGDGTLRGGARNFYLKRVRRILPPYYLAMILSLLLILTLIGHKTGTHWDVSLPVTWTGVAAYVLLLQDIFANNVGGQINHVFWSIAVEWHIYFLFPLMVLLRRKMGAMIVAILAVVVGYGGYFILRRTPFLGITPHYLALFAMGMLGATIAFSSDERWKKYKASLPWASISWILVILVAFLCSRWGFAASNARYPYLDGLVGLASLALLVQTTKYSGTGMSRRILSWKPLVWLGSFAYSLYLIHAPLIQVCWQYLVNPLHLGPNLSFLMLLLVGSPLIVGCSYLFFLYCEKPFMSRRGRASADATRL